MDDSNTSTTNSSISPQVIITGALTPNQTSSIIAINTTQVPIKLSKSGNYAAWKSQFENLLFGYGLMGFLDGTCPCPSPTTKDDTTQEMVSNPNYLIWLRQDRLILHAIQVSCTTAAQSIVTRCTTSAQAWEKLKTSYANKSNTRKLALLDSLTNVTLEGKTVNEYMQEIKSILDDLDLIGQPVDDGTTGIYVLNGLSPTYSSIASAVRARDTPMSFEELYDKLLDHEQSLRREEAKKGGPPITAQYNQRNTNRRGRGQQPHFSNHSGNSLSGSNFTSQANRGGYRGSFSGYTGQSRPNSPNNVFSYAQNHYRTPASTSGISQLVCQLCDKAGHSAKICRTRQQSGLRNWPQANHMTAEPSTVRNNWILDTGASHHMTSDLQNLSLHSEYGGTDDIMVGDGSEHGGILGPRPE